MKIKAVLKLTLMSIAAMASVASAQPQLITLSMAANSQIQPALLATNILDPGSDFTLAPGSTTHIKN